MITVITGPPCAGKSTHARQHAMPGDIIIDFDTIAQALGSPAGHGHEHHIAETAAAAWSAAVRETLLQCQGPRHAWVIDSKPSTWRAGEYGRAGARYVHLTATAQELHRRAGEAKRPASWHARIDQFIAGADPEPKQATTW